MAAHGGRAKQCCARPKRSSQCIPDLLLCLLAWSLSPDENGGSVVSPVKQTSSVAAFAEHNLTGFPRRKSESGPGCEEPCVVSPGGYDESCVINPGCGRTALASPECGFVYISVSGPCGYSECKRFDCMSPAVALRACRGLTARRARGMGPGSSLAAAATTAAAAPRLIEILM